jgi:hypothetical protein
MQANTILPLSGGLIAPIILHKIKIASTIYIDFNRANVQNKLRDGVEAIYTYS